MAKKIRFPLEMADGAEVRNLDDLRDHFDLGSVLESYKSGKLLTWLQDRYLEEEAAAVSALDENVPDFQKKLCEIFGVDYTGDTVDMEEITRRQERLEKLRTFTDDAEFIGHIDQVAFDQEELADLLDDDAKEIYLCGDKFTVPVSRKGVTYIGINNPKAHISGKIPAKSDGLEISFRNIDVDNLPIMSVIENNTCNEQAVGEAVYCHASKIAGELVDEILDCGQSFFNNIVCETYDFILYYASCYDSEREQHKSGCIRLNKQTSEKHWLDVDLSHSGKTCIDGNKFYFYREDQYRKNEYGHLGDIWVFDLEMMKAPQKLFSMQRSGYDDQYSVFEDYIAFINDNIPCLFKISSKQIKRIPAPTPDRTQHYNHIYASPAGIYFTFEDYPTYSLYFYGYSDAKAKVLFKTAEEITEIFHIESERVIYFKYYNHSETGFGNIDFSAIKKGAHAKITTTYDVMLRNDSGEKINSYYDCLLFVANGGIIKKVDYRTGEVTEIASDAIEHHYDSGGLFRKGYSFYTPVSFNRIGDWIIYPMNGDFGKHCRVSLTAPGEIEMIRKYSLEESIELTKSLKDLPEIKLQ